MTDTRTEIKAINEELEVINQFLETWTVLPNAVSSDRPSLVTEDAVSPQEAFVPENLEVVAPPPVKTVELPLAASPVRMPLAKEVLAELARSQLPSRTLEEPPVVGTNQKIAPAAVRSSSAGTPTRATASAEGRIAGFEPVSPTARAIAPSSSAQVAAFDPLKESAAEPELGSVFDEKLRDLDSQAEYVNHLAEQQVTALLKLKAAAEAAEFEAMRAGIIDEHLGIGETGWLREQQLATVSFVELDAQGCWVIRNQSVDWFQAERDAVSAAEQLRRLQRSRSPLPQPQPRQGRSPKQSRVSSHRPPVEENATIQTLIQRWLEQGVSKAQEQRARFEGRSRLASARLGRLSPLASQPTSLSTASSESAEALPGGIQFPAFVLWIASAAAVRISLNILATVAPSLVPVATIGFLGLGGWVLYKMLARSS